MKSTDMTCIEIFQQRHCIDTLSAIAKNEGIGFNRLQELLSINTATLQSRLEDLQDKEFVLKSISATDSRSYSYSLLPRGREAARMLSEFRNFLVKTTPQSA